MPPTIPTPFSEVKPMAPENVEAQMNSYADMLADDPAKAAEAMRAWADTGLIITLDKIHEAVREETDDIRHLVTMMAEGLVVFRQEVLSLLQTQKELP